MNANQANNIKQVNSNLNNNKVKEIDDINMHIYNLKDDNLNDLDFDDRINHDDFNTRNYILNPLAEKEGGDDWEYLKKTITKEGKHVSDDFIRYHQITDKLVEDEDAIVNSHMNIIKVYLLIKNLRMMQECLLKKENLLLILKVLEIKKILRWMSIQVDLKK